MKKNRYTPINIKNLGIENENYPWTIWDNETKNDLYSEWVFKTKKDAKEFCRHFEENSTVMRGEVK